MRHAMRQSNWVLLLQLAANRSLLIGGYPPIGPVATGASLLMAANPVTQLMPCHCTPNYFMIDTI